MSIIVQVGHQTSKSKQVMEKLYERGLSKPADSYTHKMTPEQVSDTLCKVLSREDKSSANEKMADNIMTDLLLSNLDSENWGWESDKNLASLEYWGQIESDVRFILVFDHPKNVLNSMQSKKITTELLDQIMSEWVSYHQAMLDFFERKQDALILVEGGRALKDINSLGVQVKNIAPTLQLKSNWQVINGITDSTKSSNADSRLQINVVTDNIFAEIINKYPEAIKVFNTLLDKSSVKDSDLIYKTKRTSLDSLVESLNYLQLEEEKKSSLANIEKNSVQKEQDNQRLNRELQESKANIEKNLEQKEQDNQRLKRELEESKVNIEKTIEQKEQDNQRLSRELQESSSKIKILEFEFKKLNNRVEEQAQSNQPVNSEKENDFLENDLLIVQIHQLQEELERYYIENKKLKSNDMSQSEQKIIHYGAAERIKQDLPYRLGDKIIKAKQPKHIVSLPFVLAKEYSNFRKCKVEAKNLPAIESYKDAYEADKVKEHLSYKVGKVLVDSMKSPKKMVAMPKNLSKEVVRFYKKRT